MPVALGSNHEKRIGKNHEKRIVHIKLFPSMPVLTEFPRGCAVEGYVLQKKKKKKTIKKLNTIPKVLCSKIKQTKRSCTVHYWHAVHQAGSKNRHPVVISNPPTLYFSCQPITTKLFPATSTIALRRFARRRHFTCTSVGFLGIYVRNTFVYGVASPAEALKRLTSS